MLETIAQPTIVHNTFVIERSYPATPERVFAAFADPAQKRRWFLEHRTNEIQEYSLDFRAGGNELARYRSLAGTPFPDAVFSTRTNFQFINPEKCILLASTMFLNEQCISSALISFEFLPSATGTDLICTHQAAFFENSGGPEMRKTGWNTLFDKLGKVLEAA